MRPPIAFLRRRLLLRAAITALLAYSCLTHRAPTTYAALPASFLSPPPPAGASADVDWNEAHVAALCRIRLQPTQGDRLSAERLLARLGKLASASRHGDDSTRLSLFRRLELELVASRSAVTVALVGVLAFNEPYTAPEARPSDTGFRFDTVFAVMSALSTFPPAEEVPALRYLGEHTVVDGCLAAEFEDAMSKVGIAVKLSADDDGRQVIDLTPDKNELLRSRRGFRRL